MMMMKTFRRRSIFFSLRIETLNIDGDPFSHNNKQQHQRIQNSCSLIYLHTQQQQQQQQQQQRYNKNVEGFSPFILHATEPSVQRDQPRGRVAKRRREKSHRAEVFR